jgi:hypothetical protein
MKASEKACENRIRRKAQRAGLRLYKARTRNTDLPWYGTYGLVDDRNCAVLCDHNNGYGYTLDEVEEYLKESHGS